MLDSIAASEAATQMAEFVARQTRAKESTPAVLLAAPGLWARAAFLLRRECGMYRELRRSGRLPLTAITHRLTSLVYQAVEMGEQFAWAHAGGFVTWRIRDLRSSHCVTCVHRVYVGGARYCGAKTCSCPQRPWWPFNKMDWWLWLHNVTCPLGRWRGSDVRALSAVPLTLRGRPIDLPTIGLRGPFEGRDGVVKATPPSSLS